MPLQGTSYDVVIIGGGPAGIAAAVVLGRCRRKVLVVDAGQGRNRATRSMHGFLTREGISPQRFLRIARDQLGPYDVEWRSGEASSVVPRRNGFEVRMKHGPPVHGRKVLLATGVVDSLPDHPGVRQCFGRSLFHCPYCDGWEVRNKPMAVLATGSSGVRFALEVAAWSSDIVLCTNGPSRLNADQRALLKASGIRLETRRIAALDHARGKLRALLFTKGDALPVEAAFFNSRVRQHCGIAEQMGCRTQQQGIVLTDRKQHTDVPGLYVAGDAAVGTHFVSVAAAEGAKAAVAINGALIEDDVRGRGAGAKRGR